MQFLTARKKEEEKKNAGEDTHNNFHHPECNSRKNTCVQSSG